jgi:hypothetical protein
MYNSYKCIIKVSTKEIEVRLIKSSIEAINKHITAISKAIEFSSK